MDPVVVLLMGTLLNGLGMLVFASLTRPILKARKLHFWRAGIYTTPILVEAQDAKSLSALANQLAYAHGGSPFFFWWPW